MKNIKNWVLSPTPPTSTDVGWIKPVDGEYKLFVRSGSGKFVPCASSTVSTDTVQQLVLDSLSYGVSWKPGAADPALTRVGNMQLHRDLPIQNGMKGCVVQCKDGVNIQYYLHPNDWRFKKDGRITSKSSLTVDADNITTYQLVLDTFSTLQYESQYIRLTSTVDSSKEYICKVKSIDTSTKTATLEVPNDMPKTSSELTAISPFNVELGSVLNGYDGEVMVEVPEFWIRSWDTDTQKEVRVSTFKIDDSWEHQPKVLIAAYPAAALESVPTNMGYLSTLSALTLVSICNTNTYCRGEMAHDGSSSDDSLDKYLDTDIFRTALGKPIASRRLFSDYIGKSITYAEYKNIIYWLYTIEYASFDCSLPYNEELTSEGYHQGGLGMLYGESDFRGSQNIYIVPNGCTNEYGNTTVVKEKQSAYYGNLLAHRWHGIETLWGDGGIYVDGIKVGRDYTGEYKTFHRTINSAEIFLGQIKEPKNNVIVEEFNLQESAELIPKSFRKDLSAETYFHINRCCSYKDIYYVDYGISIGDIEVHHGHGANRMTDNLGSISIIPNGLLGIKFRTSIVVPD